MHWFIDPIKNQYADFSGRTTRQEYWMFVLVAILISIGIGIVEGAIGTNFIGFLFQLAILIPSIAIATRRLHEINKSGWWQLISLVPVVGMIILIVWLASKSKGAGVQDGAHTVSEDSPEAGATPAEEGVEENTQKGFGE